MSANSIAMPVPVLRLSRTAAPARRGFGVLECMLWAYVALLAWQIEIVDDFRAAPSDVFLFLALILGAAGLRYVAPAWSFWQLSLPVLFAAGTLVAASDRGELSRYVLVNKCVGLGVLFLFYALITTTIRTWLDMRRVLRVFVIAVTLENAVSLAAFLAGRSFGFFVPWLNSDPHRLCGTLIDANAYGGLLVAALTVNEVASSGESPLMKHWLKNLISLLLLAGIVCTFSRSAWMALGAVWIATLFFRRTVAVRIGAAALIGVLAKSLLGTGALDYMREMASRPQQIAHRWQIIADAVAYIDRHPFRGLGLGGYVEREGFVVHNSALWFLTEFGVVGLFIFFGFVGWFLWKGVAGYRRAPSAEKPVVLSLVFAHAATFTLSMGIEAFYTRPWWLIFGLIAASYCITLQRGPQAAHYIPAPVSPAPKGQSEIRQPAHGPERSFLSGVERTTLRRVS